MGLMGLGTEKKKGWVKYYVGGGNEERRCVGK